MNRLMTRDGTADPVLRDQILGANGDRQTSIFPCSADDEQDYWQLYPVDPHSAICNDYTYIHTRAETQNQNN